MGAKAISSFLRFPVLGTLSDMAATTRYRRDGNISYLPLVMAGLIPAPAGDHDYQGSTSDNRLYSKLLSLVINVVVTVEITIEINLKTIVKPASEINPLVR